MPVFLYNYSDRTLHGIFKAVSKGDIEINPKGKSATTSPYLLAPRLLHLAGTAHIQVMICRMDNLPKSAHTVSCSG